MDRTVWKRLFEQTPTDILIHYLTLSGTTIKGFRKTSSIPRPVMITHLTQPQHLSKLRERLDELRLESGPKATDWTTSSYEDIMEEIEDDDNGKSPIPILFQLLSCPDPDVQEKATLIWESIEPRLEQLAARKTAPAQAEPPKDSSAQTKRLQKTIEKMKETHDRQRNEWLEQKKALHDELANLRQKLKDQQTLETESDKLQAANRQLVQEKQKLQEKLNAKQAQINNLTQEVSKLNDQIKSNQNPEVAVSTETVHATRVAIPSPESTVAKVPIFLVGEMSRQNRELSSAKYDIRLIDASEFEQMLQDNQLDPTHQVWLLNYEMDMRSRLRIRRSLEPERVQEFKNFHQIKNSLN